MWNIEWKCNYEIYDRTDECIAFGILDDEEHPVVLWVFDNYAVEVVPSIDDVEEEKYFRGKTAELKALGLLLAKQEGFF